MSMSAAFCLCLSLSLYLSFSVFLRDSVYVCLSACQSVKRNRDSLYVSQVPLTTCSIYSSKLTCSISLSLNNPSHLMQNSQQGPCAYIEEALRLHFYSWELLLLLLLQLLVAITWS